jgi:hypothetical protein
MDLIHDLTSVVCDAFQRIEAKLQKQEELSMSLQDDFAILKAKIADLISDIPSAMAAAVSKATAAAGITQAQSDAIAASVDTDIKATTATVLSAIHTTAQPLTVGPATLPDGQDGAAYSASLSATGGVSPVTFAVSAGSLSAGLALAADGALSGTPTGAGTSSFTVTATDADGVTGSVNLVIVVHAAAAAPIAISPTTLPAAQIGAAYSQTLSASGGAGPYIYAVSASGKLPDGLALDAHSGVISGTPAADAVSETFEITVTDSTGAIASFNFTVAVNPAAG